MREEEQANKHGTEMQTVRGKEAGCKQQKQGEEKRGRREEAVVRGSGGKKRRGEKNTGRLVKARVMFENMESRRVLFVSYSLLVRGAPSPPPTSACTPTPDFL